MKKAIFPGSFDPLTLGHLDIITRGLKLFDEVIVAIGVNAGKTYMFSLEQRKQFIVKAFADEPKVKVVTYEGLTVDFCLKNNVEFILRGLRNPADFEFEKALMINSEMIHPKTHYRLLPEECYSTELM